jgi:hypothetical protein
MNEWNGWWCENGGDRSRNCEGSLATPSEGKSCGFKDQLMLHSTRIMHPAFTPSLTHFLVGILGPTRPTSLSHFPALLSFS